MSTISPVRVIGAERLITGSCDTKETVTAQANAAVRTTFRMRLVIPPALCACKEVTARASTGSAPGFWDRFVQLHAATLVAFTPLESRRPLPRRPARGTR